MNSDLRVRVMGLFYEQGYRNYLASRGFSDNTLKSYLTDIRLYYEFCRDQVNKDPLDVNSVYFYFAYLSAHDKLEASSQERKKASLQSYSDYLKQTQGIRFLEKDTIPSPKKPVKVPRHLLLNESLKMLEQRSKEKPLEHRKVVMVLFFYSTGMRLSELLNIKPEDISLADGSIKLTGKGNKQRFVFLPDYVLKEYQEYIDRFKDWIKKNQKLFFNFKDEPLTARGVQFIIEKAGEKLGLDKKLHPHVFRHTFATQMLENGADIRKLGEFLGHESLNTTQKYTHLNRQKLKEAILDFHPHSK